MTSSGAAPGLGQLDTVTQATSPYAAPTLSYQLAYDAQGQVVSQALSPAAGGTLGNTYSHGAVLSRTLDGAAMVSSVAYNAAGAVTAVVMANGFREQVAYDAFNRPAGFQLDRSNAAIWKNGSYVAASVPYTYDGVGNILSIGSMNATAPDTFTYDVLSRLTAAAVYKGTNQIHAFAYQYDVFGNVTGRAESAQASGTLLALLTGYGVGASEATDYVKSAGFTATTGTGSNGPNNRLATVTRGEKRNRVTSCFLAF